MGFNNSSTVREGPYSALSTDSVETGGESLIKNRSVKNKQWDEYLQNRNREKSFYRELFMQNLKDELISNLE